MENVEELVHRPVTRRGFAKGIGLTGLGVAGTALLGANLSPASAAFISDVDVLNFALNLEYLEAEFYLKATWNTSLVGIGVLSASDTTGPTTGGKMIANLGSTPPAFVASGLRTDEVNHVKFLRAALGSSAVKKPAINLDALGFGYNNWTEFVQLSRIFEDVGVTAYNGAATLISNKTYLDAAARILAAEAEHVGMVRLLAIWYGINSPKIDSVDVPPSADRPFSTDAATGLTFARSTTQVLSIVYGGGVGGGGFFPSGLNGFIR